MLLGFKETILQAARNHDQIIVEVRANENWQRLKMYMPVAASVTGGSAEGEN